MDREHRVEIASGFARARVPDSLRGSGWRVFFIVAGSLCGLPSFILSAQVTHALGFHDAVAAVLLATTISATLGAFSVVAGSRTRMGLALLSEVTFGLWGARAVKLVIALSLIGWFGVGVSVLGATAGSALHAICGISLPAPAIAIPLSILIAIVAILGATGLERLGQILVPLLAVLLAISVGMTMRDFDHVLAMPADRALGFGGVVSAVVGSYIVGIVIQPDYGRFVRSPSRAAAAAAGALGVVFPAVLILSSIPSLVLDKADLIQAMIALGLGVPALAVLMLGSWIDSSACLYSGSLSIANQFPRLKLTHVILSVAAFGIALALLHAETRFVSFLMVLGVALPPVAVIQTLETFFARADGIDIAMLDQEPRFKPLPCLAWAVGILAGIASSRDWIPATGIAALDSIVAAVAVTLIGRVLAGFPRRNAIRSEPL